MSAVRAAGIVAGALVGLVAGVWLALATPSVAAAHAYLVGSDPAGGAVVETAPDAVTLTFSEPVRPVAEHTFVRAPDGRRVDAGPPEADGTRLRIPLDGTGAVGSYLVTYRVVSLDGHPIAGSLVYSVGAPSAPRPSGAGEAAGPVLRAAVAGVRYLGYAGLALLVGAAVGLARLWPPRLPRRPLGRLLWAGAVTLGVASLAALVLHVPYTTGGPVTADGLRDVLASPFGQAHLVRLVVLAAVCVLLPALVAGRSGRVDLVLLAALGVVGVGTWPFAGHPVSSPAPAVSVALGTVHVAATAFWVGGLVVLLGFLLRRARADELATLLPAWSGWAGVAVAALLLSGAVQAAVETGSAEALLETGYGRLLLAKAALAVAVLAGAAYARRLVTSGRAAGHPGRLRRTVAVEAALLAVVVGLASVLVQTTPGRVAVAQAAGEGAGDVRTVVRVGAHALHVVIEPGTPGLNLVHLAAYDDAGTPVPVAEWAVTARLPEAGVETMPVPVEPRADHAASGKAVLIFPGDWEMTFSLRLSETHLVSGSATVPIRWSTEEVP